MTSYHNSFPLPFISLYITYKEQVNLLIFKWHEDFTQLPMFTSFIHITYIYLGTSDAPVGKLGIAVG